MRYRIAPWPTRVLIPIVALVLIAGIIRRDAAPPVLIPVVVVVAAAYILAAERVGLYCSAEGFESRMTRRRNSFRYRWSDVERFELVESGAQLVIAVDLRDGSRRLLPSTKAWWYQRPVVAEMCTGLNQRLRLSV